MIWYMDPDHPIHELVVDFMVKCREIYPWDHMGDDIKMVNIKELVEFW